MVVVVRRLRSIVVDETSAQVAEQGKASGDLAPLNNVSGDDCRSVDEHQWATPCGARHAVSRVDCSRSRERSGVDRSRDMWTRLARVGSG